MANATYAINFRDASGVVHRSSNRFVFDSTGDGSPGATDVFNGLKGAVKFTRASLVKYHEFHHEASTHPAGTRNAATIYLFDAAGNIQKLTLRNIKDGKGKADFTTAFVGHCSLVGGGPVTRISYADRTLPGALV